MSFSSMLAQLPSDMRATVMPELLPVVERFWKARDVQAAMQTLNARQDVYLPASLQALIGDFLADGPAKMMRHYPNFTLAAVLTGVWLTQVRDPRLRDYKPSETGDDELRQWIQCLVPLAHYLEPTLNPPAEMSTRDYPGIFRVLADQEWLNTWLGTTDLADKIATYLSKSGKISRSAYQRLRAQGVVDLQNGLNTILMGESVKTADVTMSILPADKVDALTATSVPSVLDTSADLNSQARLTFPPLPRLRVERQQQADIIAALLDNQHRAYILDGGAGMGKTLLAGQVLRAPEVQAAFPGGIAWAAGDSSVEEIAAAWCAAVHLKHGANTTWTQCWRPAGSPARRTLLILDDVAVLQDLMVLFDMIDPNTVVLLTTQFGQETWETLARNWLEPELIWRLQVGPFSPAEARILLEQCQRRQLTDEEWAVVEQLGIQSDWDPEYLGRVALCSGLTEWQTMLAELGTAPDALHNSLQRIRTQWERLEHDPLRAYTERLAATMLEPRPFGTLYAAAVWKVAPETAARRLKEQARLGLVQALEFHDPVGLIPQLWHIPKRVQGCIATTSPSSFDPNPDRQRRQAVARQRAKLARIILRDAGPAWRAPWQFQLLGIPWILAAVLWEPWGGIWHLLGTTLGTRAPRNWRSTWQRLWLAGAENARVEVFKRRGAHVPMEYQCLTDASYDIRNIILIGVGMILVGFMALSLYGLSLSAASRAALFNSVGFRYTWLALLIGLSLWGLTQITRMLWLLYRMDVDYLPLHWLVRAAQWLGMHERLRM